MWVTVYLCGVLAGQVNCVRIQELTPPSTVSRCFIELPYAFRVVDKFKRHLPQFRNYIVAYKECSRERVGHLGQNS